MKTLHLYLVRQVLATLLLTVAVFTSVLLLGNILRDVLVLLVGHRVTLISAAEAVGLLIPFALVYALPMGMLTATLLVFGRFSADQEFTAVRAGGISLVAMVTPVILLSVVLSCVSGWFNLYLAPASRFAYKELVYQLGTKRPTSLLSENQFVRDFPGYVIYVGKITGHDTLRNLLVYIMDTNAAAAVETTNMLRAVGATSAPQTGSTTTASDTNETINAPPAIGVANSTDASDNTATPRVSMILWASEARIIANATNQSVTLFMPEVEGVYVDSWQPGGGFNQTIELPARIPGRTIRKPKLVEMTFTQLFIEYYDWQRRGIDATPLAVQMHRQLAFSFACVSFTLIGIPLGIRAHRRETSAGVGIALALVLMYYSFVVLAQTWETYPRRHPDLILWAPNFLFQAIGAALLWRANRRG